MKRQLSEQEKQQVISQQKSEDGSLRCFITGEIITESDDIEYDHIIPFSKGGDTSINNIRVVLKTHNRRKSDQSLYEVRDNIKLEKLFDSKKNNIKLQDILILKDIKKQNTHATVELQKACVTDGSINKYFNLFYDSVLTVFYFYGRIPVSWLENDDQEGLQPRVIDYKRLIALRDHLKNHPQLAPSIARLLGNKIKLFDGQHKLAAQILNDQDEVDIKVYISPENSDGEKKLFDALMLTNLEAHSKLKQVPFYTSTLLDRLSVIYKELLEEFIETEQAENHTEEKFVSFLVSKKQYTKARAKDLLKSAIKNASLLDSDLDPYVAEAARDANYPITNDLLDKTLFPATLFLEPSSAKFTSDNDFRNAECQNFSEIATLLVQEAHLKKWVRNARGNELGSEQLKARRIWHKGAVLTWTPYLKSILGYAFQFLTNDDRQKLLYRKNITADQLNVIKVCLNRLFNHPMWDEPEGEIDSLLVSAQKQDELFTRKGLTEKYVLTGEC